MTRAATLALASAESDHLAPVAPAADAAWPLSLAHVTKRWRKDQPPVLNDLSLTLEPGEVAWVGGENGVGKTTLLRIAAGLIRPDAGEVTVWGARLSVNRARYHRLVSFLPAGDRGLYARLTVRRQLEFCARLALVRRACYERTVELAIAKFELDDLADRRVDRISMGQRQRVRIAMTFLAEPEIVLLDEPLTSLDANGAALLGAAVSETLARDGTVLWCSPSGEHQQLRFDRRWVIERGRLARA
jgi:ABC-2 type transport system ATP-binding protein